MEHMILVFATLLAFFKIPREPSSCDNIETVVVEIFWYSTHRSQAVIARWSYYKMWTFCEHCIDNGECCQFLSTLIVKRYPCKIYIFKQKPITSDLLLSELKYGKNLVVWNKKIFLSLITRNSLFITKNKNVTHHITIRKQEWMELTYIG